MRSDPRVMLITGTRKGIGRYLTEYYLERGWHVVGCSRGESDLEHGRYRHFCVDVADEDGVRAMMGATRREFSTVSALLNNAGISSMNHSLLTPMSTARKIFDTNVLGTFLFCREAARLMQRQNFGRIVNFATVATKLRLEGEALYACSKAAVASLTEVLARELAPMNITVNALGPTPIKTDLIAGVPTGKMDALINRQAIRRYGEMRDVSNAVDFFLRDESDFITGQVLYLGGV